MNQENQKKKNQANGERKDELNKNYEKRSLCVKWKFKKLHFSSPAVHRCSVYKYMCSLMINNNTTRGKKRLKLMDVLSFEKLAIKFEIEASLSWLEESIKNVLTRNRKFGIIENWTLTERNLISSLNKSITSDFVKIKILECFAFVT